MNLHQMNLKCGKETGLQIAIKREPFNGRLFQINRQILLFIFTTFDTCKSFFQFIIY